MPFRLWSIVLVTCLTSCSCGGKKGDDGGGSTPQPNPPAGNPDVAAWITTGDQQALLQKQTVVLTFGTNANAFTNIDVDSTQQFQTIDGFGYTLTSGSAYVINRLSATDKSNLLKELFGNQENSISISYLRLSIGASDLSASVYSYDDMPAGQTDPTLAQFSLSPDKTELIPLLKEIVAINPAIKFLATPWSPPVWMKDNGLSVGGSLKPEYYEVYAKYFVKYIQAMKAEGITIDAITPQNEPLHPGNNPSLYMTAEQQAAFIKNNLGPAFQTASLATKIIVYDHNCNRPDYPLAILNDAAAKAFVNGSAFHLYEGDINTLSQVHNAHPDKHVYFTEQYTASNGNFGGDLKWHLKNVIVGATRNWSRVALEWNLANDASYGPHTPGGCTTCKGALTIGGSITRNVAYYIVAHASKLVPAGSVRIASNIAGNLQNVAFLTPAGKKVLIVSNDGNSPETFNIRYKGKWVSHSLAAGSVGTYVW
ncbi:glycoside hydrolase family 30 beta sandwich domain-containing protein [Paraflavitalea sp. CAU 1676]|uniref:glycoside hydrolase family 30 protein n=1 Tax=Paraflavitalea sp. CAU 1676 TaxID=3032598 RepID=UPI0023DC5136|nr:glycoside hydrolase family 30 beta sandwich domain-containing protein [Paraflavitalea sp. CAU 1676]MDF2186841.1 glycoside hydrolase family 30 beta sandwich domain-containing protein [Paraflavitalea sp. CAU 1676]